MLYVDSPAGYTHGHSQPSEPLPIKCACSMTAECCLKGLTVNQRLFGSPRSFSRFINDEPYWNGYRRRLHKRGPFAGANASGSRINQQECVLVDLPNVLQTAGTCIFGLAAALLVIQATPAEAAIRLPPIDKGKGSAQTKRLGPFVKISARIQFYLHDCITT